MKGIGASNPNMLIKIFLAYKQPRYMQNNNNNGTFGFPSCGGDVIPLGVSKHALFTCQMKGLTFRILVMYSHCRCDRYFLRYEHKNDSKSTIILCFFVLLISPKITVAFSICEHDRNPEDQTFNLTS